jgi:hypothetical protein
VEIKPSAPGFSTDSWIRNGSCGAVGGGVARLDLDQLASRWTSIYRSLEGFYQHRPMSSILMGRLCLLSSTAIHPCMYATLNTLILFSSWNGFIFSTEFGGIELKLRVDVTWSQKLLSSSAGRLFYLTRNPSLFRPLSSFVDPLTKLNPARTGTASHLKFLTVR